MVPRNTKSGQLSSLCLLLHALYFTLVSPLRVFHKVLGCFTVLLPERKRSDELYLVARCGANDEKDRERVAHPKYISEWND